MCSRSWAKIKSSQTQWQPSLVHDGSNRCWSRNTTCWTKKFVECLEWHGCWTTRFEIDQRIIPLTAWKPRLHERKIAISDITSAFFHVRLSEGERHICVRLSVDVAKPGTLGWHLSIRRVTGYNPTSSRNWFSSSSEAAHTTTPPATCIFLLVGSLELELDSVCVITRVSRWTRWVGLSMIGGWGNRMPFPCVTCRACKAVGAKFASGVGVCLGSVSCCSCCCCCSCAPLPRCAAGVPPVSRSLFFIFLCVFPLVLLFTWICFYMFFFVMFFISSAAIRFRVAVLASGLSLPTQFSAIWLVSLVEMLMCAAHHYLLEVQNVLVTQFGTCVYTCSSRRRFRRIRWWSQSGCVGQSVDWKVRVDRERSHWTACQSEGGFLEAPNLLESMRVDTLKTFKHQCSRSALQCRCALHVPFVSFGRSCGVNIERNGWTAQTEWKLCLDARLHRRMLRLRQVQSCRNRSELQHQATAVYVTRWRIQMYHVHAACCALRLAQTKLERRALCRVCAKMFGNWHVTVSCWLVTLILTARSAVRLFRVSLMMFLSKWLKTATFAPM